MFRKADPSEVRARVAAPREWTDTTGARCHEWDSPAELADWMTQIGKVYDLNPTSREHWMGGWSLEDAIRYAKDGYPAGTAAFKAASVAADKAIQSTQPDLDMEYHLEGSFPDVAAYVEGTPEHMVQFIVTDRPVRTVRIFVSAFVTAQFNASTYADRGRAIASAALALQAQGLVVEVAMRLRAAHPQSGVVDDCIVHVWKSGHTFDPSTLAATIAHVGFIRALMFQAVRWAAGNTWHGIYGTEHERPIECAAGEVLAVGIQFEGHPWSSPEACRALMARCLAG